MHWDVVVLQLETDEGIHGHATVLAARSGSVTQSYIHDNIAPVVLGRDVTDREAIWHELWNIDRHLTFFPVYLPGPIDVALWDIAAKAAELPLYKYLGAYRQTLPSTQAACSWILPPHTSTKRKAISQKGSPRTKLIHPDPGSAISKFIAPFVKPLARRPFL